MAAAEPNLTDAQPEQRSFAWMVIFTDLVALMLTFFVLLFSMSAVSLDKYKAITDTLSQSLKPNSTQTEAEATAQFNIAGIFRKPAFDLDYLTSLLTVTLSKDSFLGQARLIRLEDRIMISIPGNLLFTGSLAVLTEKAQQAVSDLGRVLRNIGNKVTVNGHTEPDKNTGDTYASNWELSLARAVAVANKIRGSGYTENLSAFGYAGGRYKYLAGLSDVERRLFADRIDIIIMPTIGMIDEE